MLRPWDDQSNSMENAKTRMKAAFEFMSKLGIRHYTFHDVYVSFTLSAFSLLTCQSKTIFNLYYIIM